MRHKFIKHKFELKIVPKGPWSTQQLKFHQICSQDRKFVQLQDFFEDQQFSYFVSLYRPKTLRDLLMSKKGGAAQNLVQLFGEAQIKSIVLELAMGLSELHKAGIVHGALDMDAIFVLTRGGENQFRIGRFDQAVHL